MTPKEVRSSIKRVDRVLITIQYSDYDYCTMKVPKKYVILMLKQFSKDTEVKAVQCSKTLIIG